MYKSVKITAGKSGFGGPLILTPNEKKNKIISVTGGGIHEIAQLIADMTGAKAIDGFTNSVPDEEILVAIVDCGGTARCGVYPKKNILTINLMPVGAVGPLAQFITKDLYVSDVKENCIEYCDDSVNTVNLKNKNVNKEKIIPKTKEEAKKEIENLNKNKKKNIITIIGQIVGKVVGKFFQAGRETIDIVIKNVLPFMAFTSMLLGIISASGLGNIIAKTISPLCSTLPGMLIISLICALPFLSPVLGPGAVIAQVVGTLLGAEIGLGNIPVQYALPALFAINAQVGGDFVPVGLSLGEAEPETIEIGVPAVLISRIITGPLSVIIAYIFSIGMY